MRYEEVIEYIERIPKFTKKTSLAHTRGLLERLGNPDRELACVHVAGTNGKGSVCAFMASALSAAGLRVGLFTSPHLVRINERFRIGGADVSDADFVWAFAQVMEAVRADMAAGTAHPTYFETLFLMSMVLFRRAAVDVAVLEVGMGGRLDATNVVERPLVSVITSISLDHEAYLGNTVAQIAGEKAGICKAGVPVVYDANHAEAAAVIAARAAALACPAVPITRQQCRDVHVSEAGTSFDFWLPAADMVSKTGAGAAAAQTGCTGAVPETGGKPPQAVHLRIPQSADYQVMNAALAYRALQVLPYHLTGAVIAQGLAHMSWPCRMEQVRKGVVIDGAHNPDGMEAFIRAVQAARGAREVTLLFGAVADKKYPAMIAALAAGIHPAHVVTTEIGGSRCEEAGVFAALFRAAGVRDVTAQAKPAAALRLALEKKGEDGVLFCVGSLYLAGELKAILAGGDRP